MARYREALATGGSIVVSDQGINQGETGEYTDFIVCPALARTATSLREQAPPGRAWRLRDGSAKSR